MKSIGLVLLIALAAPQSGQQAQTTNLTTPGQSITPGEADKGVQFSRKVKDSDGCIYLDGTGNLYYTYWGNICAGARQFTIQWYGGAPPRNVTYRTNNSPYVRQVRRQDTNGALISEAPATMGLGPKTPNIRLEERDVGQGQTLLSLAN